MSTTLDPAPAVKFGYGYSGEAVQVSVWRGQDEGVPFWLVSLNHRDSEWPHPENDVEVTFDSEPTLADVDQMIERLLFPEPTDDDLMRWVP